LKKQNIKLLVDESCDFIVVKTLRNNGYHVISIAENSPGIIDSEVLQISAKNNAILITEDRDFGEWVFAHRRKNPGVIFIRYPSNEREKLSTDIMELINKNINDLYGSFIVLEPGKVRIRKM